MMLEDGMEPAYCAERLGHSLEMFFKTYAKWTNADKSAAQAAIWARMK
jgi:integrase